MDQTRVALLLCLLLSSAGCAFFDGDNRRLLNAMDEHLTPESVAARWALAPIALPAGGVGLATDMVLVHPVCVIDDAWQDTVDLLWTSDDESRFRRGVMIPLSALATPFVFVGDWLGRALFAIPEREGES